MLKFINSIMLLLFLVGCSATTRQIALKSEKTVCDKLVHTIYNDNLFTGMHQVVISDRKAVCNRQLVALLRKQKIAVVKKTAISKSQKHNPLVSLNITTLTDDLLASQLLIKKERQYSSHNQLFQLITNDYKTTVIPVGAKVNGVF